MNAQEFALSISQDEARAAAELLSRVLWRARWETERKRELEASRRGGQLSAPREEPARVRP